MPNTNSLIAIEQIYNFLKVTPDYKMNNQFDKLKDFFFELNDHKIGDFESPAPLKFIFNFNKSWISMDAVAAPDFNNKTLFLNWVTVRLNIMA